MQTDSREPVGHEPAARIAIVGMACRYPDAGSPAELWENALAGRRAFRRLPDVRMRLADYWDADPAAPDRFYSRTAAVLEGYEFDRVGFRIAGRTYRSTDLTHWLALEVAAGALADAGFPMGEGLPRQRTSVIVGNTLTGEFSRASLMRLRWPYVARTLSAALDEQGWDADRLATFLADFETRYKASFPPITEDTLAGGLANTIAGRVCNYFDLGGGGYTVDGACSSSLLSVATACRTLLDKDIDVAIAGGVDLSIDPFEIVGFAKTGALARKEMRVYDRGSNGFWPGEGCGMVVLMREPDARAAQHRIYATVAGWGISSDGSGGITRPEVAGYQLALSRAYERAGFGIDTVPMFEGHGTGTPVGDATELKALSSARAAADPAAAPAAISTVKGIIGHTKAAAGIAGLIKAAMAVHRQVLPPTAGCVNPHEVLSEEPVSLRVLRKAEPWPDGAPVRAGVSSMGFGGINTHIVLDEAEPRPRAPFDGSTRSLAASVQDVELLLIDADSAQQLRERLERLIAFVPALSYAQLGDLAATAQRELGGRPYRAAVVAGSPQDAQQRLQRVLDALEAGETALAAGDGHAFLGHVRGTGRIGYLFPGQGSGRGTSGGALRRRFAEVEAAYLAAALPTGGDVVATAVAQPRIVTGSMAGLRAMTLLGLAANVAVGHSLGEISALCWAGAIDDELLLRVASVRGQTMAEHSSSGTMASVGASPDRVQELMAGLPVVIAGYNAPEQTVIAGPDDAVRATGARAGAAGLTWTLLPVSHAFHSELVAPAADVFGAWLAEATFGRVDRRIISTVTGQALPPDADVPGLLRRQITAPVLFAQAIELAAKDIDLFIEVGPGRVLSGLATEVTSVPAVALNTDDESLGSLLRVAGAAFVAGAPLDHAALFRGRFVRPLEIGAEFSFLASPCEQAPSFEIAGPAVAGPAVAVADPAAQADGQAAEASVDVLRRLAAQTAELPADLVRDESRLLDDLHLSSITVGQIMNRAAQELGLAAVATPTNFATASLRELAEALDEMAEVGRADGVARPAAAVTGAAPWVRAFAVELDQAPRPDRSAPRSDGHWQVHAPGSHPLAEELRQALVAEQVGGGVLVCLPDPCTEQDLELALRGAQSALAGPASDRFVLVQHGRGAAGLAKTLRLEAPQLQVTIAQVPPVPEAVGWVAAEVAATESFTEVHYDADGVRRIPVLRAMPVSAARAQQPLTDADVLLVTGGGKGITAECALALASASGARLAVLGRSEPTADTELAANLQRMADAGLTVRYVRADVTRPDQVRDAIAEVTEALGPVTAVLHGAGRNEPGALGSLDMAAFRSTFAPKVDGLRHVLAAIDPGQLRLLVAFGSIIGQAGLRGEAHYATANEWLADLTRDVAEQQPQCRSLCLEWSVWSGVGMGERLSVVEALAQGGVTPITPDQGVAMMQRLVADPDAPAVMVISGRTGGMDTVRFAPAPALPLLRFVDRPLIRYDGVELVTEVDLNAGTDRYLADHLLDGNLLFPAVFGMEAMTQVARAVTGRAGLPVIEQAEFLRPIVVPPDGSSTIRVAAVVTDDDTVEVVIHNGDTGFVAEHFRARLRFTEDAAPLAPDGPPDQADDEIPLVALDPATDLYGSLLFQGPRFWRLRGYHRAAARHVDADVAAIESPDWFASFLPGELLMGDPGMRDALMHGNQVCVPDATLLPIGIDRVYPGGAGLAAAGELRFSAVERLQDGDTYVYDIAVRTQSGQVLERWEGLQLRAVRKQNGRGPWLPPLLGSYLERTLEELLGSRIAVCVEPFESADPGLDERRAGTALAAWRALGRRAAVRYRPDGRPEVDDPRTISASHGAGVTLFAAADGAVGCDVEPVVSRPLTTWDGLLRSHAAVARLVASETGESLDTACTRMWAAVECSVKAGLPATSPITLAAARRDEWTVFDAGGLRIATLATSLRDVPGEVVFAVGTERRA
ncbi:MAG TPA: type I polyketide synthase [Streptosporangiaceae bacterium]|jgi:enediyne polyketide synthase